MILAAVAVGLSTRRYSQRHIDGYAVMRCFGASQARLFALFAWEFLLLGVAAALVGALAGYVAQYVIAAMVSGLMLVELPQPTLLPALQGINRTWFCGSYCGYGFHEDAFKSGLAVAEKLGASVPWGSVLNVTGKPVVVRPAA